MNSDPFLYAGPPSRRREAWPSPPFRITCSGASDRGRERPINQDRFLTATLSTNGIAARRGHLLAVADGVGGAKGGERASALAVHTIDQTLSPTLRHLREEDTLDKDLILDEMRACFRRADERIRDEASQSPALVGMATTMTIAACMGRRLYVAHAGDSRCCLLRNGLLRRLTLDHTVTAEMVRRGLLTAEIAREHRYRHVLTECVGGGAARLNVELRAVDLHPGDVVLLCTDGLTEMVPSHEVTAILLTSPGPEMAVRNLVARANERGGHDNVTAVVARCENEA